MPNKESMTQSYNAPSVRDGSQVRILGLSGSTRKGSFNTALLHASKELLPENTTLEIHDLSGLPLFSQDIEHDLTPAIRTFKQKIREADTTLRLTRTQLFDHGGDEESDRMGKPTHQR